MSTGSTPMTAGRLWASWARRWRVLASCVLLGLLAGAGAFVAFPASYTATAVVLVSPVSVTANPGSAPAQLNMPSERSAASSGEVIEASIGLLSEQHGESPEPATLRDSLSVTVPTGSSVLHVAATTDDPARSARWANAIAESYLAQRGSAATASTRRIAERIQGEITQVTRTRAVASAADRVLYDQQLARLWERQQDLLTGSVDPGRVVTTAQPPAAAASPGWLAFLVAGAGLGALLGAALALARDRRDPLVRSTAWLHDVFPGALIADDPQPRTHARRLLALAATSSPRRIVLVSPDGPAPLSLLEGLRVQALSRDPRDSTDPVAPPESRPTPRIIDLSSFEDPSGAAWSATPDDLVVLIVGAATRRAEVDRIAAELAVTRADVSYVAFRPTGGWVAQPVPGPDAGPSPHPADVHSPDSGGTRGRSGRPVVRKHEVSP